MDIEGLFSVLWDSTLIIALLTLALGFVYIAMAQKEASTKE